MSITLSLPRDFFTRSQLRRLIRPNLVDHFSKSWKNDTPSSPAIIMIRSTFFPTPINIRGTACSGFLPTNNTCFHLGDSRHFFLRRFRELKSNFKEYVTLQIFNYRSMDHEACEKFCLARGCATEEKSNFGKACHGLNMYAIFLKKYHM